jgi:Fur family transcriptional regulator, ferric uptake regulator
MTTRSLGHRRGRPSLQRKALVATLAERNSFRSVAELYDDLRAHGHKIALVTIYRHLQIMTRQDAVTMVKGRRGEARYRLRSGATGGCPLVCRRCQRAVDTDAAEVAQWARETASRHGFVDVEVHTLATGVCLHCLD